MNFQVKFNTLLLCEIWALFVFFIMKPKHYPCFLIALLVIFLISSTFANVDFVIPSTHAIINHVLDNKLLSWT